MKQARLLFAALAVSAFLFGACGNKCITCSYTDSNGAVQTSEEVCGNQLVRDALVATWELAAALDSAEVTCE